MTAPPPPACWAISDGAAGNERQALALAQALGFAPRVMRLHVRQPWQALAPHLLAGASWALREADGSPLQPPWPGLAIGCGRRAALATRALRRWSRGQCYGVQILDPRIDTRAFDLVIAPAHDRLAGSNVIASIGALNPVDGEWLAAGRLRFAALAALPGPRTTVLIGASTRAQRLDGAYFDALLERLQAHHANHGGSFLVSLSRRTPTALAAQLRQRFASLPGTFWAGPGDGDNPYAGLLGWADRIVVTPDSVNMISEACATGKPVYTFAPRAIGGKLAQFHAALLASGHLRELGDTRVRPLPPALAETGEIAALVRERWLRERIA
ncbi:MAG: nucleoside-diphosphate sugar epimerase [Dokdonella sp.]|nr:MAG: nucleoside-diphosphate sugar epimerase [Dokdonella sp.]